MKLTFLGTGSAFSIDHYNSNLLLEVNGAKLLIDCGGDIRFSLDRMGLSALDIDAVYISHLHADHIGGIEYLALSKYFAAECKRPFLFIHNDLSKRLWDHSLKGGLGTLDHQVAQLSTYFDVKNVNGTAAFKFSGVSFQMVETIHYNDGDQRVPSFGLMMQNGDGPSVFLTTDTKFTPTHLQPFYEQADVVFHDCETSLRPSGVHSRFEELCTLPAATKSKMWLYHYQDGELPDAAAKGFAGFVKSGQVFEY